MSDADTDIKYPELDTIALVLNQDLSSLSHASLEIQAPPRASEEIEVKDQRQLQSQPNQLTRKS